MRHGSARSNSTDGLSFTKPTIVVVKWLFLHGAAKLGPLSQHFKTDASFLSHRRQPLRQIVKTPAHDVLLGFQLVCGFLTQADFQIILDSHPTQTGCGMVTIVVFLSK
jgi:hypothetical protein